MVCYNDAGTSSRPPTRDEIIDELTFSVMQAMARGEKLRGAVDYACVQYAMWAREQPQR